MNWTTPADLRTQVQRLWDRGELLRATVGQTAPAPLQLKLKSPSAADLSNHFEAVRHWARSMAETPLIHIEWREWKHRIQGTQHLPASARLDTVQDALAFIGKTRQAQQFQALWQHTAAAQPALLAWLCRRPLQALELAEQWQRLLAVVAWLQEHPRPGVYLRQVDAPGVDSKFIEAHRSVLAELLDLALPPEAIDAQARGSAQFAQRFGFLGKPARIRFRLLDAALPSVPGCQAVHHVAPHIAPHIAPHLLPDITLDAAHFAALALPVRRVFITENETNFLAFPPVAHAIVIFGAGYGWQALAQAHWLHQCQLHYWGDIDTHGFAILDQLRAYFPGAQSFLMDAQTLLAHRPHWSREPEPVRHHLPRLSREEAAVYDSLRFDHHQPNLRLEQERVGYGWLRERLAHLAPSTAAGGASTLADSG